MTSTSCSNGGGRCTLVVGGWGGSIGAIGATGWRKEGNMECAFVRAHLRSSLQLLLCMNGSIVRWTHFWSLFGCTIAALTTFRACCTCSSSTSAQRRSLSYTTGASRSLLNPSRKRCAGTGAIIIICSLSVPTAADLNMGYDVLVCAVVRAPCTFVPDGQRRSSVLIVSGGSMMGRGGPMFLSPS